MSKTELVMKVLEELDYEPEIDDDGDLLFMYQLKTMYVLIGNEEEKFLTLMLPQIHEVDDPDDVAPMLATGNRLCRQLKLVKVFIDNNLAKVNASCEFYYYDEASLKFYIERALNFLGIVRPIFYKEYSELKSDE